MNRTVAGFLGCGFCSIKAGKHDSGRIDPFPNKLVDAGRRLLGFDFQQARLAR